MTSCEYNLIGEARKSQIKPPALPVKSVEKVRTERSLDDRIYILEELGKLIVHTRDTLVEISVPKTEYELVGRVNAVRMLGNRPDEVKSIHTGIKKQGWLLGLESHASYDKTDRLALRRDLLFIDGSGFRMIETSDKRLHGFEDGRNKEIYLIPPTSTIKDQKKRAFESHWNRLYCETGSELTISHGGVVGSDNIFYFSQLGLSPGRGTSDSRLDIMTASGGNAKEQPEYYYRHPLHISISDAIAELATRHSIDI